MLIVQKTMKSSFNKLRYETAEGSKLKLCKRIEEPTQYRPLPAFDLLFCSLEIGYINGGGERLPKA